MARPLIGITGSTKDHPVPSLENYIHAVEAGGGTVVVIPPPPSAEHVSALVQRLDGIVLPGGEDVTPAVYHEEPHPRLGVHDAIHDAAEIAVAHAAIAQRKPILSICRGQQIFNVALGGTLFQDLAAQYLNGLAHTQVEFDLRPHTITLTPETLLHQILGEAILPVNSLHHQAIKKLGNGLQVSARASDGVIEAVELPGHPFALAVQYHPEALVDSDPFALRIFTAFIAAVIAQRDEG